ncbi:MAG: aminomethyl-transferring glycine dehydrogenase subunit GcvPB, partial [Candidatus Bathyarchaeia archaeon]
MTFRQAVWTEPLLSELSSPGRRGSNFGPDDRLKKIYEQSEDFIPQKLKRTKLALPSLSEPQVVRHFLRLSQMNFGVDFGMYPLGSCTMKYNPKIAERLAGNPNMLNSHPLQYFGSCQGILEILYDLSEMLAEITGMARMSLAPAAGAQGEYVGTLIMKAFFRDRGELEKRREILIPDSAHGTNPATAVMAGFRVIKIASNENGLIDVNAVKEALSDATAGVMLTVPNTLGLFENKIEEISKIVHDVGGLMYYDGANMNALLGRARPGDMGFDIVHLNLHKTFSTPHGGGGPGAGPVGVAPHLIEYLPIPLVEKSQRGYYLEEKVPKTIGRVRGFVGNVAILLRAYVYILLYGKDGLPMVSGQSVLAA